MEVNFPYFPSAPPSLQKSPFKATLCGARINIEPGVRNMAGKPNHKFKFGKKFMVAGEGAPGNQKIQLFPRIVNVQGQTLKSSASLSNEKGEYLNSSQSFLVLKTSRRDFFMFVL